MLRYLHTLSAILFYVLGSSMFVAYILLRNALGGVYPRWWLEVADLPLLVSGMLYGGLSVYLSVHGEVGRSRMLIAGILAPLIAAFIFAVVLNFWPLLS